jgi:cysteine-rich repeat protein
MLVAILAYAHFAFAEDAVCGDGVIMETEACDDGNLAQGDGCSPVCTLEGCGNGLLENAEQCDDGNTRRNDGCSEECALEFCGDGIMQILLGEGCDDGNGVDGDDCSAFCKREDDVLQEESSSSASSVITSSDASVASSSVSSVASSLPSLHPAPKEGLSLITSPINQKNARESQVFLASEQGKEMLALLSPEDQETLKEIILTLSQGKKLTPAQKKQASVLQEALQGAIIKDQAQYTGLLQSLIQGAISENTVLSQTLDPTILRSGSIDEILQELASKKVLLSPSEQEKIRVSLSTLKNGNNQMIDVSALQNASTALQRLQAIVELKKQAEELASGQFHPAAARRSLLQKNEEGAAIPELKKDVHDAFAVGDFSTQKKALTELLTLDSRTQALLSQAQEKHLTDLTERYDALMTSINTLGEGAETKTLCDDTAAQALQCVYDYLTALQDGVRNTSFFTRTVGTLQDYFDIQQ